MAERHLADLVSLDRDVARGEEMLAQWRADLGRSVRPVDDDEPLEPVRYVAGKSTWDALGELAPSRADEPLRDALRGWVAALLLARVGARGEVAWGREAREPRGRFAGDPPALVGWRQAWRGVVSARTASESGLWLDAAGPCGPELAAAARARATTRVEASRRLGLEHPWAAYVPAPRAALRSAAARLLDATEELALEAFKTELRGPARPAAVLHAVVARDASEGWPARLGPRWLFDTFGRTAGRAPLVLPTIPGALGASSFARALATFGAAVRLAAIEPGTPFALAREPGARAAHRLGFVFASLAADPEWQVRTLGVGRRTAHAQSRVLARTMLFDARLHAVRLLLGDETDPAPRDLFEELGPRLLGSSLDERLRGAWPAARDDEPARFVGLLESLPLAVGLRRSFDADWFRNPRAWAHLRETSGLAAREPVELPALEAAVDGLARAFEAELA